MKYLFLFIFFLLPVTADAVWFDSAWDYRVKVEVVPSKVGSSTAVTSFPIYNDCGGFPVSFWTLAKSDGSDIRVVESDEITETPFELVTFSTTSQKCELHFLADTMGTTSTSTFYIHYGNAGASAYASSSTYGRNNVWTGYTGVWHLATTTGATGAYDLITNGVDSATAKLGDGYDFGGVAQDDYLQTSSDAPTTLNTWTATAWVKMDSLINYAGIFSKLSTTRDGTGGNQNFITIAHNDGTFGANPGGSWVFSDAASLTTATWYRLTWVRSGTTIAYYVNGTARGTDTYSNTNSAGFKFFIGSWQSGGADYRLDGLMDEVRFTQSALSQSWMITEFNNQNATSTFFVIGAQEAGTSEATTTPSTAITGGGALSGGMILR